MYDIASAGEDIADNPVYVTLNLCRVLAYLQDGLVLSKAQGGSWGLTHLPAGDHHLLQGALAAYAGGKCPVFTGLEGFAAQMLQRIRALI